MSQVLSEKVNYTCYNILYQRLCQLGILEHRNLKRFCIKKVCVRIPGTRTLIYGRLSCLELRILMMMKRTHEMFTHE